MSLNSIKPEIVPDYSHDIWLEINIIMGILSSKIMVTEPIEEELVALIKKLGILSAQFDINLDKAWVKWKRKAVTKIYV